MKKIYLVQMEEIVVENDSRETIEVWEDIFDYTYDLEEAKRNALQLLNDIRQHKASEVFEVNDANNHIGVCVSEYDEDDDSNTISDVIEIGMLAHNLLLEEYPLSERDMSELGEGRWMLDTMVCNYKGIGRFVLGLMSDIKIVDSPEFKDYIRGEVNLMSDNLK